MTIAGAIILTVTILSGAAAVMATRNTVPTVSSITCTDDCPSCDVLIKHLKDKGIKTRVENRESSEQPVPWFPCVDYSNGETDWGARIYHERCKFNQPVHVIHWKEKK